MRITTRDLYTLNDQYMQDLFLVRSLTLAGYVILFYECVATFPDEVKYIWPTRWSMVKSIYLFNRYGNVIFLGLAGAQMMGIWWDPAPDFCFRATIVLSFTQLISFALIHVLVLLRAWATWGRQRKMLTLLGSLFLVYASVSIAMLTYGVIDSGAAAYPLASITQSCISTLPDHAWVLWVPSLALECATFVLTMVSIRQFNIHRGWRDHSNIVRIICRDGVAYFLVTLFSNSFNILVWALYADRPLNMLSSSFTLCLMIVAGQRLVLDLRMVTDEHDGLSTTRVGREVERAIEALARPRSPSPIVFVDHSRSTPLSPTPSPRDASREPIDLRALVAVGDDHRRDGSKGGDVVLELTALKGGVESDRTVCV